MFERRTRALHARHIGADQWHSLITRLSPTPPASRRLEQGACWEVQREERAWAKKSRSAVIAALGLPGWLLRFVRAEFAA